MKLSIIGLKTRRDRRKHILLQFNDKKIFDISVKNAVFHKNPNISLWLSICEVIKKNKNEDVLIVCEDDHLFTPHFSETKLLNLIKKAKQKKADLLLGGISWFSNVLSFEDELCEVDFYNGNQFCVFFKESFDKILNHKIKENLIVDMEFSLILQKKYVIAPFISIQKNFFYSDMRPIVGQDVEVIFSQTENELLTLKKQL